MKLAYLSLFLFIHLCLEGALPPVAFTFMIADLKHNEEEGIKICELQSGTFSAFRGYDWLQNEPGCAPRRVIQMLSQFNQHLIVHPYTIEERAIRKEMKKQGINFVSNYSALFKNQFFRKNANRPVEDPHNLSSYPILLIANKLFFGKNLEVFKKTYPNVLILDVDCFPYWRNKYKMTTLFQGDPELEKIKPYWKLVNKEISLSNLEQANEWFHSEYVVIKPLNSLLGKGIIILKRDDLPKILTLICKHKNQLKNHDHPAYRYWATHKHKELMIEEFHHSDPVVVEHLNHQPYDGTLRISFMLWLEHGEIHMEFVESHWKVPYKAINEEGTLMEKHKSYDYVPHFAQIEPERQQKIEETLRETIPKIYMKMLEKSAAVPAGADLLPR